MIRFSSSLSSRLAILTASAWFAFVACDGGGPEDTDPDTDGPDFTDSDVSDDISIDLDGGGGADGGGGGGNLVEIQKTLPPGFTANTAVGDGTPRGGWMFVGPVDEVDDTNSDACGNVLRTIARDMSADHPDFGSGEESTENIVTGELGEDRKPVFKQATATVESKESFDQWYRNTEGLNAPYVVDLWLEPVGDTFIFDSGSFFPLDELGLDEDEPKVANANDSDGQPHRFLFTTELHTKFEYQGGEVFTFRGDDDVFVYINGALAVNLGGIHGPELETVDIDDFAADHDMEIGTVYTFDLFQAERKPTGSNFRIETTLDFSGCSEILPGDGIK